jgi:methyl-accepting chemotaxis protein
MKKPYWIILIVFIALLAAIFYLPGLGGGFSAKSTNGTVSGAQDLLIKSEVETAVSMLQGIADQQAAGKLTPEQAKDLGAALLRGMTYGTEGYFWAHNLEGYSVVLYGRKDVEGTYRLQDKDDKGNYYVKDFLAKGTSGGGFVDYWYPKKGETVARDKRSYVLESKPFGWVVGSGYYK